MLSNDRPFIHLFSTPFSKYIFEVNRNELVPISEELFENLKNSDMDMLSHKDNNVLNEIEDLKKANFLMENPIRVIEHPYSAKIKKLHERNCNSIILQMTQKCNLRCSYCVYSDNAVMQRNHTSQVMTWNIAKKAIDFLADHSLDSRNISIGFYGGEPLLEFKLIKRCVKYAKCVFEGKSISFTMTTNGTLLTSETVDFLAKNNFAMMVSLDGPEHIHDQNRCFAANSKGSFKVVVKNMEYILNKYPVFAKTIKFNMVLTPYNNYDDILSITSHPVLSNFEFNTSMLDTTYNGYDINISDDFSEKTIYHSFLAKLGFLELIDMDALKLIAKDEAIRLMNYYELQPMSSLQSHDAPSGPCIPGITKLFITVNGDFYPCEKVSELSEFANIGTLDCGFDYDKIYNFLNVSKLTEDKCINCWALKGCNVCGRTICGNDEVHKNSCAKAKYSTLDKIRTRILFYEINKYFKKFLRA